MIYPSIIQKKYEIKANQSDKKVDLLRNSSHENIREIRLILKKIYIKLMKIKKYFNQFLQNNQFILN
jgi:hypothetical protein